MSDDLTPHTSGYMKPPKSKRFKKGKSGNPKGGPKAIDNPSSIITKVLARRITVAGSSERVTMLEALTYKLRELALTGDRQALKLSAAILKLATKGQPSLFAQKAAEAQSEYRKNRPKFYEKLGMEYPDYLKEDDKRDGYI
jgi:Family of unknown function (DUF5681)